MSERGISGQPGCVLSFRHNFRQVRIPRWAAEVHHPLCAREAVVDRGSVAEVHDPVDPAAREARPAAGRPRRRGGEVDPVERRRCTRPPAALRRWSVRYHPPPRSPRSGARTRPHSAHQSRAGTRGGRRRTERAPTPPPPRVRSSPGAGASWSVASCVMMRRWRARACYIRVPRFVMMRPRAHNEILMFGFC
jgi:hypothetical protein